MVKQAFFISLNCKICFFIDGYVAAKVTNIYDCTKKNGKKTI
jgi:hypothetical protein